MPRVSVKNGNGAHRHAVATSKYDANNKVLSQTYGAFADLRRELADSKDAVGERGEILRSFATCPDSQRSWLLLEDYFEKLSLSRKDFPATEWWPRMLAANGNTRLEELAFLFLRAKRSLPPELTTHANMDRFARAEAAEHEHKLVRELENWLFPPQTPHLDTPRATLRVLCQPQPDEDQPARFRLGVQFHLFRPRTGEKVRSLRDLIDLATRAAHEQELFPPADWEFIAWLTETHRNRQDGNDTLTLSDTELLHWLARWGHTSRLEFAGLSQSLQFQGHIASLDPHLENGDKELSFTHRLTLPTGEKIPITSVKFFNQQPPLVLAGNTFYLLRNAPPASVIEHWTDKPAVPVRRLSHRLLMHLRRTQSNHGVDWEQLCVTHKAAPQMRCY